MKRRAAIIAALLAPFANAQNEPSWLTLVIPEKYAGNVAYTVNERAECMANLKPDKDGKYVTFCAQTHYVEEPLRVALEITYKGETIKYSPEEIMEALRK
jgi:hypothetical protein